MVVLNKTILILEDDLLTVSKLLGKLARLEEDQPFSISTIILSNYQQVEEFINSKQKLDIDIVLLDRDCKLTGSFHVYDIEKFGADNIISISSVPEYNQEAQKRGVKKTILKDYRYLDKFADEVVREIENRLKKHSLLDALKKRVKLNFPPYFHVFSKQSAPLAKPAFWAAASVQNHSSPL